jgi:hypothetical protein
LLKRALWVLAVLGAGGYMVAKIGPRNVVGLLRYDQRHAGKLQVGDPAPDVTLTGLDGAPRRLLSGSGTGSGTGSGAGSGAGSGGRPVVLVFGSYT